jgi:hypothetical protein
LAKNTTPGLLDNFFHFIRDQFVRNGFGYLLGDFSTNSSGHPDRQAPNASSPEQLGHGITLAPKKGKWFRSKKLNGFGASAKKLGEGRLLCTRTNALILDFFCAENMEE